METSRAVGSRDRPDVTQLVAYITGNLCHLALERKEWLNAELLARQALPLSEEVGRLDLIATDSHQLSRALLSQGMKAEALGHARRAVELYTRLGSPDLAEVCEILAECES